MTKKEFEKRYLNKLVKVRFHNLFLEPTQSWVQEEDEYVGHLVKDTTCKGNYYYLEEHVKQGVLWSSCFSKGRFKSIKLVKE